MIKKKLSRIEDFISPTCFSYQANAFRYSYKFPSTPTLYKTKHDSSFYFLNFIIRTKLLALRSPSRRSPSRRSPSRRSPSRRSPSRRSPSRRSPSRREFATQTKLRALYTRYLIQRTREGSLTTFGKMKSQKITTIFFNSTDTTSYIIIRPLINCSRKSISITCRLTRLPVYPDLSNLKLRYSRNRIRKQIIPTLKFFLNPKIEKSLFKFSENLE